MSRNTVTTTAGVSRLSVRLGPRGQVLGVRRHASARPDPAPKPGSKRTS